jgi:hypothetical protein
MPTRPTDEQAAAYRKDHYVVFQAIIGMCDQPDDTAILLPVLDELTMLASLQPATRGDGYRHALIALTWHAYSWISRSRDPYSIAEDWKRIRAQVTLLADGDATDFEHITAQLSHLTKCTLPEYIKEMNYPDHVERVDHTTLIKCCLTVMRVVREQHGPDPQGKWRVCSDILDLSLTQ